MTGVRFVTERIIPLSGGNTLCGFAVQVGMQNYPRQRRKHIAVSGRTTAKIIASFCANTRRS